MNCLIDFLHPSDKRIACDEEFSESEDEGDPSTVGGRRDRAHRRKKARTDAAGAAGECFWSKGWVMSIGYGGVLRIRGSSAIDR